MNKPQIYKISAIILFIIGLGMGMFLWTGSVWADIEGYMFQPATYADQSEYYLRCPNLITTSDFGIISIGIENNSDKEARKIVRGNKTLGYLIYIAADETILELAPGESEVIHWYIYPEDAAWDRFVLFRANIISSVGTSLTTASCGVMVINVPFLNSNQFLMLLLIGGMILITLGIYLMYLSSKLTGKNDFYTEKLMIALTGVLIIGLLLSLFGQWLIGGLLLVGMYIFLLVTGAHYLQKASN
jgi:hypothetical protein